MDVKTGLLSVLGGVAVCSLPGHHRPQPGARGAVPRAGVFQASAIWMLLKAEFLAITLVLVYVGAVMVLFLFVVMMLDINLDSIRKILTHFRWRRASAP